MKNIWHNYGLSVTLLVLFLLSWLGQFAFQVVEVMNNSAQHGQEFSWSDFWPQFGAATMENWQSEFLQLLTFVILTSFLIHKGSAESKDSDDEIMAALARIEGKLGTSDVPKDAVQGHD